MIYYVAATNHMSWGRGVHAWEAIGNALAHAGRRQTIRGNLYEVTVPEPATINTVYVNEMGAIVAPPNSKVEVVFEDVNLLFAAQKFDDFMTVVHGLTDD